MNEFRDAERYARALVAWMGEGALAHAQRRRVRLEAVRDREAAAFWTEVVACLKEVDRAAAPAPRRRSA